MLESGIILWRKIYDSWKRWLDLSLVDDSKMRIKASFVFDK